MSGRIDTSRPWHERMAQARRWHLHQLHALDRRPANRDELLATAASSLRSGWTLACEPTRDDLLADYRRVVRRNNPRTLRKLADREADIRVVVLYRDMLDAELRAAA